MLRKSIFYITIMLTAATLYLLQKNHESNIISFYGYAENKETEINFNYPVQVKKIHVSPGQHVKANAPIIDVVRIDNKNQFADQQYKIDGLRAEENIWKSKVNGQIQLLREERDIALSKISQQKEELLSEAQFEKQLYEGLSTIDVPVETSSKNQSEMLNLDKEYQRISQLYAQRIKVKEEELNIGSKPYESEISRLQNQKRHNDEQELIEISTVAPKDGLIGNVYCKEEEHFTSYKTLISFYEPNPSIIKGFIQEDFIMQISLEDSILVRSTKDEHLKYHGKVIGLGSRIVEIPARLRKREDIKTYGREIIVSIPRENAFLQKEKTILELINTDNGSMMQDPRTAY